MPFEFSDQHFDNGELYLRIDVSGEVTLDDAKAMIAQMERPEHRNGRALSVVAKGTVYTPEARKHFPKIDPLYSCLAAVVTSPVVRAAINLMVRLTPQGRRFRMFKDERSALEWLINHRPS